VKSGPATATVGGTFSYQVTVTNTGTATVNNVTITDNVPATLSVTAVSFTKANPAAGSVNCTVQQNVSCNVGSLLAGQSATVTIAVTAGPNSCPAVSNSASVTADGISAKTSNTVVTTIPCPPSLADLSIVKSGPATATVGASFSYTVTVTNNGTGPANNVTVTDSVSGALTVTAVTFTSPAGPGTCPTSQNVNCNVGTLLAGQSATVTIAVTAGPNSCPSVQNTATVSADGIPPKSSNTVTTTIPCPPNQPSLSLNKTGTATVTESGAITYTVTVTNSGTAAASNVVITDNLDDSLTSVAASSTIGTCSVGAGNVVTCNIGTLAAAGGAGASATITITAHAPNDSCPTITNQATGTHSGGTIPASGTVTTTVTGCAGPTPEASVLIQKTNDANEDGIFSNNEEAKNDGQDVDFELVITNTSDVAVEITDLTDSFGQTTLDLLDDECAALAGMVLDPGESVTCTFTLNDYSPAQGTAIVNVAEVCVQIVNGIVTACDTNPSRVRTAVVLGRTVTPTPTTPPSPVRTTTPPGGIAFTGPSSALPLTLLALALLTLGTGLLWAGRRREGPDMG
jgi:uncharacterized repeat protein (TIGR01451 family)